VADDTCQTIAVVASQLIRLCYKAGPYDRHLPVPRLLAYCASGLSQRLQRLELPQVVVNDRYLVAFCGQLPVLSFLEVATFLLMENHANLACSWQEMVISEAALGEMLARLPLARSGRQGGVRKLTLRKIAVCEMTPAVSNGLASVCCSGCQLSTISECRWARQLHLVCYGSACLQGVSRLLRQFEPGSVETLTVTQRRMDPLTLMILNGAYGFDQDSDELRLQALTAFAAEVAAGHAGLNSCRRISFCADGTSSGHNWYTPAVCSAMLPALMPSSIASMSIDGLAPDAAVAVCSPEALAAVTRPMILGVGKGVDVAAMQAAINAAGKGHLLTVKCMTQL
jgi:hypothetical protein